MRGRSLASWAPLLLILRQSSSATASGAKSPTSTGATASLHNKNKRYKPRKRIKAGKSWKRFLDEQESDYQLYDDNGINEKCSEYLIGFLEGTTDAKDTCEGIQNAYVGASCESVGYYEEDNDQDDYFGDFYEHKCCESLIGLHSEYCQENSLLTNMHLLVVASALLFCEVAKSLVKRHDVRFLPEAAVCILVGVVLGILAHFIPGADIESISFDGEVLLAVLLPPIIFEASLTVSKEHFRRRRLAIFMFAVFGTIMSTFVTGFMVHYSSKFLPDTTTLPLLDSLIYGGLISSIDPVAILSVLASLHLDQTDTVYILVFGESLLNDGVAITVSHVLIDRFGEGTVRFDEILGATADFLIMGFGSIAIGFICSLLCLVYFWLFRRLLNPGMEVGSFFLWALIPYWVCDGVGWSGIVAIVTAGFFMDIYIASTRQVAVDVVTFTDVPSTGSGLNTAVGLTPPRPCASLESPSSGQSRIYAIMSDDTHSFGTEDADGRHPCNPRSLSKLNIWDLLHKNQKVRLSRVADKHVRFVAHLMAQLAENSIFVYLGLFLFSQNYDWDFGLVTIGVISCIAARAMMVVTCCYLVWQINVLRGRIPTCGYQNAESHGVSRTAKHLRNRGTQLVLIFAGLRGAVSLALVENVPLYNNVTGQGCEYKPVIKAMTSASIIFTMFVFGGSAYYIFPMLGIRPDDEKSTESSLREGDKINPSETEMARYQEYLEPPAAPRPPSFV